VAIRGLSRAIKGEVARLRHGVAELQKILQMGAGKRSTDGNRRRAHPQTKTLPAKSDNQRRQARGSLEAINSPNGNSVRTRSSGCSEFNLAS